jgi:5-methylcytosine-specific restriction protein A
MTRREFPPKVKVAAWDRCKGNCEGCGAKLYPGKFAYDHDLPDGLGGEPVLANCRVLCTACHSIKSFTSDIPRMAKATRGKAKFVGAKQSKHRLQGPGFGRRPSNARELYGDVPEAERGEK